MPVHSDSGVAGVAQASVPGKCLRVEFSVAPQAAGARLTSSGLLIVNPPWKLADELKAIGEVDKVGGPESGDVDPGVARG